MSRKNATRSERLREEEVWVTGQRVRTGDWARMSVSVAGRSAILTWRRAPDSWAQLAFFSLFFFAPFGRLHLLASSLKMLNCSLLCLALAVLFLRFDHANLWRILAIGPLKMIGLPAAGWMVVQ